MSTERRQRRDQRSGAERLQRILEIIARAERRTLGSVSDREDYLRELMIRGIVVDRGPHPSGSGRLTSFMLERIQGEISFEEIAQVLSGGKP